MVYCKANNCSSYFYKIEGSNHETCFHCRRKWTHLVQYATRHCSRDTQDSTVITLNVRNLVKR